MNPIATKRPGVYSQYAVTSLYARPVSERAAALVGVFPEVEGVTRLSRYSEAAALLEGWALAACSLLFGRGVAAVYLSPAATDTAEGYAAAFAALEPGAVGFLRGGRQRRRLFPGLRPEQREDGPRLPCPLPGRCGMPSFGRGGSGRGNPL